MAALTLLAQERLTSYMEAIASQRRAIEERRVAQDERFNEERREIFRRQAEDRRNGIRYDIPNRFHVGQEHTREAYVNSLKKGD